MKYFVLATLIFMGCSSENRVHQSDLHLQIGTGHLNKGQYPDAIRELRQAEKLNPDNPLIHNNLAIALFARKRFEDAQRHFEEALSLKPDYTEARNNLGRLLIDMKKYDEAIKQFNLVLEDLTYRSPSRAHANLALAYIKTKKYKAAEKNLERALELESSDCYARGLLGQVFYYQKQYSKAVTSLDSAVQLCKNLDEAYYFSALSYLELGQKERATARMKELIALYPESRFAQMARSELQKLEIY